MTNVLNRTNKLPQVTQELLDYLRGVYSLDVFKDVKTIDELRTHQGEQKVIDHLQSLLRT